MLDPIFTHHADERRIERGISRELALQTLHLGRLIERHGEKDTFAHGRVRVVVVRESGVIVTAWRERKPNPKRLYRKKRKARRQERQSWRRWT
jgi:hypothetical protein